MTSNARNVYERIEQNQIMAVTADQVKSTPAPPLLSSKSELTTKSSLQISLTLASGKKRSVAPRQEVKDGDADM